MGAIALRVQLERASGQFSDEFLKDMFSLLPLALSGTGVNDDIRIATRFHANGIDVDLSSDHMYGAHDTSITRLAAALEAFFRSKRLHAEVHILRAGEHLPVTPISTLSAK